MKAGEKHPTSTVTRIARSVLALALVVGMFPSSPAAYAADGEVARSAEGSTVQGPGEQGVSNEPSASEPAEGKPEEASSSATGSDSQGTGDKALPAQSEAGESGQDETATREGELEGRADEPVADADTDEPEGQPGEFADRADEPAENAIDLAPLWNAGAVRIDEAGDYTLGSNVESTEPLEIALPDGASAQLDLAGHDVTVSGDALCAIDLSGNAGEIELVDSSFDEGEAGDRASIVLEADDPQSDVSVVRDMRAYETSEALPKAIFEHVSLEAKVTVASAEAYAGAVTAVASGVEERDDGDWTAEGQSASLSFTDCEFRVSTDIDDSRIELDVVEPDVERGTVSAIDAGCSGIELAGAVLVEVERDGEDVAQAGSPVFLSAYESAYTLASDMVPSENSPGSGDSVDASDSRDADEEDDAGDAPFVFGFPYRANDGDGAGEGDAADAGDAAKPGADAQADTAAAEPHIAREAVVAVGAEGESISEGLAGQVRAETGYEVILEELDSPEGDAPEYAAIKLATAQAEPRDAATEPKAAESPESPEGAEDAVSLDRSPAEAADESPDAESASQQAERESEQPSASTRLGAKPHIYAEYLESHADEVVYASQLETQASGTNLNTAWKAKSKDYSSAYSITSGGTYYLNADLKASSSLLVNAPGKTVTIKLNGHTLALNGTGDNAKKTMVSIAAAKKVVIDGSTSGSSSGTSAIESVGNTDVWAVSCAAVGCEVVMNDLSITLSSDTNSQRYLSTHVVRASAGKVSMSRCRLNMLMGNQTLSSADSIYDSSEVPSAVYATGDAESVTLADCTVVAEGPQGFSCDMNSTADIGNVYGVYSLAGSTEVSGGTYTALSLLGNATCLYGSSLHIGENVTLNAGAKLLATGVLSLKEGSVSIDAPVSFTPAEGYEGYAQAAAALRSQVADGFVLGDLSAADAPCPVLVMAADADLSAANSAGVVVGSFAAGVSGERKQAVCALLSNALGTGCSVALNDAGKAGFAFDSAQEAGAVAKIGSTYYPTLASALAAFANGTTLILLADAGDVAVSTVSQATLDLNGHAINSLEFATSAQGGGLTVKGGEGGRIDGLLRFTVSSSSLNAAVYHHGSAPLVLDGVTVVACGTDVTTRGIYAASDAGMLTLKGATKVEASVMRVTAASGDVCGVDALTRFALQENSIVRASTVSAACTVVAVQSTKSASFENSVVSAYGTTGTTGGAFVGGSLSVSDSVIDVYTTDVNAAQYGYGIWARNSDPKATSVSIARSTVKMTSAASAPAGYNYACLLGSTTETGSSETAWTLSGENTFKSTSSMHMGSNLGSITLDGFSLSAESDQSIVVSQAKRAGNVGFALSGTSDANALKSLFAAKAGSYYEGWHLESDAAGTSLIWRYGDAASADDIVKVVHADSSEEFFPSLASALADSGTVAGNRVELQGDLAESGVQTIAQRSLTLDLNGHVLTVRAGRSASTASGAGAVRYTGDGGVLTIEDGTLDVRVGSVSETMALTYQGISVTNGGELSIGGDAVVNVSYTGSSSPSAVQQATVLHGIALVEGTVDLVSGSELNVISSLAEGGIGAMTSYGIFVEPTEYPATVNVESGASLVVDGSTGASTTSNPFLAKKGSTTVSQSGPAGLREITVDPSVDADFYKAIASEFKLTASYDDPKSSKKSNGDLKSGVFYSNDMALEAPGKWYDGLRLWAYSDVVSSAKAGKLSSIVPTHLFVSTSYDTVPAAYGIFSSAESAGEVAVNVAGSVSAACQDGDAYALDADGVSTWRCEGAALAAESGGTTHLTAQGTFDLRDFIEFTTAYNKPVRYSAVVNSQLVKFTSPKARGAVVGGDADFTFDGETALSVHGLDEACVEASSFKVDDAFSLASGTDTCSIANGEGANKSGSTFAVGAKDASLFSDAYGTYKSARASDGAAWRGSAGDVVTFNVGDAVVARYLNPTRIDLAELSDCAAWPDDQRYSHELVGWSLKRDERAVKGYTAKDASLSPKKGATYYAVYDTGLTTVPVSFSNVFKVGEGGFGELRENVTLDGDNAPVYGQTVGQALEGAGVDLPEPEDYIDRNTGMTCRFVGWHAYSASTPTSPLLYSSDKVKDLEVSMGANGVGDGALELRAVYLATRTADDPRQFVVKFEVDGYTSACVVTEGQRPVYKTANGNNASSVEPAKSIKYASKKYTFEGWTDASDVAKTYASALPLASGDATYKAKWLEEWADVKLKLHTKRLDTLTGQLREDAQEVTGSCEKPLQQLADSVAKIGSKFAAGGKIYTLIGWAVRETDAEPTYTKKNPLPEVSGEGSSMTTTATREYYGVYTMVDHKVDVTFYDGSKKLGTAKGVVANTTSINKAFSKTGSKTPANKSNAKAFLGWADSRTATTARNGDTTMIEKLAGSTATSLSLYAVYGTLPSYTVKLRSEDGKKVWYRVNVSRGSSVNETLAEADKSVTLTPQVNRYFAGFYSLIGAYFSLDAKVTGVGTYNARYGDISVSTPGKGNLAARILLSDDVYVNQGLTRQLKGMSLSFGSRGKLVDTPLRSDAEKYKFTVLKSYSMKLTASYASDGDEVVDGSVGTVEAKVHIDDKYKNLKFYVMWLGKDKGKEVVKYSSEKTVDKNGFITVDIGDYSAGDEDEGGNFAIVYRLAGTGGVDATDDKDPSSPASQDDGKKAPGSTGAGTTPGTTAPSGDAPGQTTGDGAGLQGAGGIAAPSSSEVDSIDAALASPSLGSAASLSASGLSLSGVSASGLSAQSSASPAAASSATKAIESSKPSTSSNKADADSGEAAATEAEDVLAAAEEDGGGESPFADWDSDAVVLIVLAALAVLAMVYGLWRLIVVRQRRNEAEAELPSVADRYSEGLIF